MNQSVIKAGSYTLSFDKHTLVMGILNVTPDSFSDGGKYNQVERAVAHAKKLVRDGAEIIDIGGESTRPQAKYVSAEEELARLIPVIEILHQELDVPISVDTYKAEVALRSIRAGAHIINDVWGATKDPDMARIAAELDVPIILMHNRQEARYDSLMDDICKDLLAMVRNVRQAGVKEENIILDPGIGFAKNFEENLTVMHHLERIVELGYPVLLGTSRKSMIGHALNLPTDDRLEGTAATVALGIAKGCQIVRVHDVKEMSRVCRMMDAMLYGVQPKEED
ncbi:dihydropteroate synthase [Thermoactinomyces mirandus]|uniref:Dihydropteroate synthase n=1 Tax=Thermoactinomyces mirandus TaxID=2756294 RepID=A0A7W1XQG2_9BACL|nr:dihydropteroate synthase [Thermoactinomyces mirandus]MBA4601271.1 dihydropteroate synthase [Thermoactinomyces mirandus]